MTETGNTCTIMKFTIIIQQAVFKKIKRTNVCVNAAFSLVRQLGLQYKGKKKHPRNILSQISRVGVATV